MVIARPPLPMRKMVVGGLTMAATETDLAKITAGTDEVHRCLARLKEHYSGVCITVTFTNDQDVEYTASFDWTESDGDDD